MADRKQIVFLACLAFALAVQVCGAASVTVQGELEASDAVWLGRLWNGADRGADVLSKIVPQGTRVKKGDVVLQFDTTPMERDIETAQSQAGRQDLAVQSARAKLDALRGQLDAQKQKAPALLAPFTLEVERLEGLPDPVDLAAAEARLRAAQASVDAAESRRKALDQLADRGMASQQAVAAAGYDAQIAAADRDKAQARLDGVRAGADPFDLKVAGLKEQKERLQIESDTDDFAAKVRAAGISLKWAERGAASAAEKLAIARENLAMATRCAPVDGVVVYAPPADGVKVAAGASIWGSLRVAAVTSGKSFRFRGRAGEAALSRIRPGLPARVHVDALPGTVLQGHVAAFDVSLAQEENPHPSIADTERPRPRLFEVVVALDDVPEGVMQGMSARAELQLDDEAPVRSALSEQVAKSLDAGANGPLPLLLGGYVEPTERAPVFTHPNVGGYVCGMAKPYSHVEPGDPILECTGERAKAALAQQEDGPKFAQDLLDLAKANAEQDAGQRDAQVQAAELDVQIAQVGLDRLNAPPRECDVRAADADVRGAQAALKKAQQKLSIEKAAALASGATIDRLELDVQEAEVALQQAQLRAKALSDGPQQEEVRLAEFRVEHGRKEKAMLAGVAASAREAGQAAVHTYEVRLDTAEKRVQDAQTLYDKRVLRAPIAGNVVFNPAPDYQSGRLQPGDTISKNTIEVAYVADLSKVQFCAVLDQDDVWRVHAGRQAQVELVALPGRLLTGHVTSVMPLVMDREEVLNPEGMVPVFSGVRCSKALISLDLPADLVGRVLPSMTGTARMLPEAKTAAAGGPR